MGNYTNKELASLLGLGNSPVQSGGGSFYNQYTQSKNQLDTLNGLDASRFADGQKELFSGAIKSSQVDAIAGGVTAGLNGLTSILNNSAQMTQTADTPQYDNQIGLLQSVGNQDYNNFSELNSGYQRQESMRPDFDYDTIRGMDTGEKIGNVANSTLSGASAGMQIGGPVGAAIGAGVGLLAGGVSWAIGDKKAKQQLEQYQADARTASNNNKVNLASETERLRANQFRGGVQNRRDFGGAIETADSLQAWSENIVRRSRRNDVTRSAGFKRIHGNGGTVIRIKR